MAETVANIVEHDEQQNFSLQDSDQPHLADHGVDQQNMSADVPEVYNFVGDVSEDQTFIENEPEDSYVAVMEQHYSENDTEQPLNGVQHDQALTEDDSKQEFSETVTTETENAADNSHSQKKDEHENKRAGGVEKKWPGWPGDSVFRMLVPAQKVGNIIGRKGEYIKKLVEETKARIKVINGPPGSQERAVMVSAKEDPDSSLPPAIDGLLKVHRRITDGLDGDTSQVLPAGGKVSTKLLVPATQAGILIGKQGSTIKSIQETSSCIVRVLGPEDLPVFALQEDRVVEVAGDPANVHSAVELIASHLRKFLVDRSIIPVFEKQMQAPSGPMEHMPPQPWGPPHGLPMSAGGGHGYGPNSQYMPPPPRQYDNYYPPADMPPPSDRHSHQPMSSHGREPAMGVHASSNMQSTQSMVTQVTQHMQIPLLYADAVIGANGSTISYIRRASGAAVTVQESRGAPGDMTVEINGTSSQVQAAQQLIQNFMAEAAAQTSGSTEQAYSSQGYNSYAPPTSTYGSPPSAAGHASQASGGAYGYGGGYGY